MLVLTESGRRLTIPHHHSVFEPVGEYAPGEEIDPETVEVIPAQALFLLPGSKIIVDNRVEVVTGVAT
jgi:hypothetical protein